MVSLFVKYVLVAAAAGVLLNLARIRSGTTLNAPLRWALLAFLAVAAVEIALDSGYLRWSRAGAWQFLAATSTVCPGIALLGAKRPQNQPWQLVVATLWLVLALPAIQSLVLGKSGAFEIHPARSVFLMGLILFCAANSLISRFWPAVLLATISQLVLLHPNWVAPLPGGEGKLLRGITGLSSAILVACLCRRRGRGLDPLDLLWLDIRDRFGLVWSLRMMEQLNFVATSNSWDLRLRWTGFRAMDGSADWNVPTEQRHVLRQALHNLLRRFVSTEWIASRLDKT